MYALQHREKKWVHWGVGWDLFEAQKEEMELARLNVHPNHLLNNLPDPEVIDFFVVKEVPIPLSFQLEDFERVLARELQLEFYRYRRFYSDRVAQLYKWGRLR